MRIAVYGAGGVGGYFGGRLAKAGEEVIFIARGEHLQVLGTQGLRVDSIQGDFKVKPLQVTDDPKRVGQVDIVLLGVKAWQIPDIARSLLPLIGPDTAVVPLQNGVDAPAQLAATLGIEHVLGGLCQISAVKAGPGYIRHIDIDPFVAFGELNRQLSQRVERLHQAFERAGVQSEIPADILAAMWRKFLFIAPLGGIGAVTRAPVGIFRSLPETRQMLEESIGEIIAIAKVKQIDLENDSMPKTLRVINNLAPDMMASMQRDIMDGRPSELGSQNGAVVRMGLELGIPTPTHKFIYYSLLPQELQARSKNE